MNSEHSTDDRTNGRRSGRHVDVSGASRLGDVDAATFDASGSVTVEGDVDVEEADLSGATAIEGNLIAESVGGSGSVTVTGNLSAITADVRGRFEVEGEACIEELNARGSTTFGGLDAETADLRGALAVDDAVVSEMGGGGKLEATSLEVGRLEFVAGEFRVRELVGTTVRISRSDEDDGFLRRLTDRLTVSRSGPIRIGELAATTVSLHDATVEEVTADRADIGAGCEIARLRAREWEIHPDASVAEIEQPE